MRIAWKNDRFEMEDQQRGETYDNKELIKQHGFRWDPEKKAWYCPGETQRLSGLRGLEINVAITPEAKAKFDGYEAARLGSIHASRATDANMDIPVRDGLVYLPYQRGGVAYASSRRDTLFADEMGLGKTIQAIGTFNADLSARSALIICPASLKLNWQREWQKWNTKGSTIAVIRPGQKEWPTAEVIIINYDLLSKWQEQLRTVEWDIMIIDEAHYLKEPRTGRTQEIFGRKKATTRVRTRTITTIEQREVTKEPKRVEVPFGPEDSLRISSVYARPTLVPVDRAASEGISYGEPEQYGEVVLEDVKVKTKEKYEVVLPPLAPLKAKRRLFLTGTPIVNRPKELWPIVQSLCPGFEKDFMAYAMKYCNAFKKHFGWDFNGASRLPELQERLRATCMVRRLKADVLKELPPKRRQVMVLESEGLEAILEKEKKTYEQYSEHLKEGDFETPAFADMSRVRKDVAIAKIPFIVDHVKEVLEEQAKVCVFVHHHEMVDALRDAFGDSAVTIDGRTSNEDRQAAVDRFQGDETCKVFVGTIRAAGVGITLTASSTVIFGELDWVPGNVTQAEDRCHRIGQQDTVFVRHLVLEGSLDERMAQIILDKQEVIDKALDAVTVLSSPEFSALEEVKDIRKRFARTLDVIQPPPANHIPGTIPTQVVTREQLEKMYRGFSDEQEQAVLTGLRILASKCDGAEELDGQGFNKRDTDFGKSLAQQTTLSEKQFKCGQKMIRLYHRQLPPDLIILAVGKESQ